MTDLQQLFHEIEKLPPEELEQVRQFVEERSQQPKFGELSNREVEARLESLHNAIGAFREGLSEEELQELLDAMNYEQPNPNALKAYDWLDDAPEDES